MIENSLILFLPDAPAAKNEEGIKYVPSFLREPLAIREPPFHKVHVSQRSETMKVSWPQKVKPNLPTVNAAENQVLDGFQRPET